MSVPESSYRRFPAPAALRGVVEHVWVVRHAGPAREVALCDGHGVVQVVLGAAPTLLDPLTGAREADGSGVRGPLARTRIRQQPGAGVRLGAQLHPAGAFRLGLVPPLVDRLVGLDALAPAGDDAAAGGLLVARDEVASRLAAGADEAAAATLLDALTALPRHETPEADRLEEVLGVVAERRGLVRATDLARGAGVEPGELHRWFVTVTGRDPAAYLAAVRFATFVREVVGPGPVAPSAVVAAIGWYVQAGYPPREVERFTGLPPAELRRLEERLSALLAPSPPAAF